MHTPAPSSSALVGRDHERTLLREKSAAALAGNGGLVLIGGEAGVGKTALAEAVCQEAERHGALVLVGRCYDLTETPPYGPWIDLFVRYVPSPSSPPLPPAFARRGTVGPVESQMMLFVQVRDFIADLATRSAVVILLDDLHWADPASLDLLRFLARAVHALPILLLVAYRSDELLRDRPFSASLPALVREGRPERIDLRPLDDRGLRTLVSRRYPLGPADAARLIAYLRGRAEGNPFFLGELLRTLEEEGVLRADGDGWTLGDLTRAPVPPVLRQIIDGRLARLGEEVRRLLGIAAVIGQEVPLVLWAAITGDDEEQLLDAVEAAAVAHIVDELPEGTGFRFVHALIREALYEGMSPLRRRVQHLRIGEVLAETPDVDPDAVAYHLRRAGEARAVAWLVRAGEHAEKTFAWLTAAERYEAAVALLMERDTDLEAQCALLVRLAWLRRWSQPQASITSLEAAGQRAARLGDPALSAVCQHVRGILRCRVGEFLRGLPDLEAGATAINALPVMERARLARLGVPIGPAHEGVWGSLILRLASSGRIEQAMAIGVPLVAESPPSPSLTDVHFGLAYAYAARGEPDAARRSFASARDGCRARKNPAGVAETALYELEWAVLPYATDALAARQALAEEGNAAWLQVSGAILADVPLRIAHLPLLVLEGEWGEARRMALAIREANEFTSRRFLANRILGPLAFRQGELSLAWSLIADTLPRGHETPLGDARFYDSTLLQRLATTLALEMGDLANARAWLGAHDRWLAWSGATLGQAEGQALWAQYHRQAGDMQHAHTHAQRALAHAAEPRQPLAILAAHRLIGELDTTAGRHADAAQHLHAALLLADACAAPFERALTLLARADLAGVTGDRAAALALLAEVRTICTPLDAAPTLARAGAMAERLASRSPRHPMYPDRLTSREVEVLRLIAAGKSNREIATDLFLSLRTAERHIANIYAKIGAHGRADATRYASNHHLIEPPPT